MAYGQIGIIQTVAAFCAYFFVMSEFGFSPTSLLGISDSWNSEGVAFVTDSYGQQWPYDARKVGSLILIYSFVKRPVGAPVVYERKSLQKITFF